MKHNHKLGPQDYKFIKEQANILPQLVRTVKNGTPLARAVTRYKGASEFRQDDRTYKKTTEHSTEPVYVNHEVEMVSAFHKNGQSGVHEYIERVNRIAKAAEERENNETEAPTSAETTNTEENA